MAQVLVRNIEDETIETLRARAKAHGHSLEQELREVLRRAARPDRAELLRRAQAMREQSRPGNWPTAEEMIREDRDRE